MDVVLTSVDTKGFEAVCGAIAKITGKGFEEVIDAEVARILDQTIVYTKTATKESIDKSWKKRMGNTFTSQPASLYAPKLHGGIRRGWKGNAVKFTKNGYVRYNLAFKYPTALWTAIRARITKQYRDRYLAIGLSKKSWWVIGRALGLPVKGGRFTSAVGIQQSDFSVSRKSTSDRFEIGFENAQPTINNPRLQGRTHLQSAIDNRVKAFLMNLEKGVFNSMQKIARQYPGLKITQGR